MLKELQCEKLHSSDDQKSIVGHSFDKSVADQYSLFGSVTFLLVFGQIRMRVIIPDPR